jgi:hypothetical protein
MWDADADGDVDIDAEATTTMARLCARFAGLHVLRR